MDHCQDPDEDPEESGNEVGYCKPPKHTRWKPGECPNPRGRPKNAKGRRAILERILAEMCEVRIGTKVVLMRRVDIVLTAVRNATANGNPAGHKLYNKLLNEVSEQGPAMPKGILFVGEKLTEEEWLARFGYLGCVDGQPPPSRKRGLMPDSAQ